MQKLTTAHLVSAGLTAAFCTSAAHAAPTVTESQVVEHYADLAHAVFEDSRITAQALQTQVEAFVANPSAASLDETKQAWLKARVHYQQSEVFRFGNAIVDDWEGQLNAWPLDEGLIDYVDSDYHFEMGNGGATANIIANQQLQVGGDVVDVSEITPKLIASLNEIGGSEANVASGYHAIEFLLWGQDLNGTNTGAGQRAYTDFVVGESCTNGNCDRRSEYLTAVTQLLVDDLKWMEAQWSANSAENYRAELLAESTDEGLRKMLFGMGSLSLGELAGERMKVALEANSTEDEHDCFSDNTHNSHYYNEQGIYNVYTGLYIRQDGSLLSGPSLHDLVTQKDSQQAEQIQSQFDNTRSEVRQLVHAAEQGQHFDQLIASQNQSGNEIVNSAIIALVQQTASIEQVASIVGVDNLSPDTADHQF